MKFHSYGKIKAHRRLGRATCRTHELVRSCAANMFCRRQRRSSASKNVIQEGWVSIGFGASRWNKGQKERRRCSVVRE